MNNYQGTAENNQETSSITSLCPHSPLLYLFLTLPPLNTKHIIKLVQQSHNLSGQTSDKDNSIFSGMWVIFLNHIKTSHLNYDDVYCVCF